MSAWLLYLLIKLDAMIAVSWVFFAATFLFPFILCLAVWLGEPAEQEVK